MSPHCLCYILFIKFKLMMRRTQAPSQCFRNKDPTKKESKPFPEASRNTTQLLNILSNKSEELILVDKKEPISNNDESNLLGTIADVRTSTKQFNVVWGKQTKKKHKTWEGDGTLIVENDHTAILKDQNGLVLGRSSKISIQNLVEGFRFLIGSKEVEIIDVISHENAELVCTDQSQNIAENSTDRKARNSSTFCCKNPSKRLKRCSTDLTFSITSSNVECLTMPRPDHAHQWKFNKKQLPVTDVRMDFFLSKVLRPHQKEGAVFLYSCVSGIRDTDYFGAILADEMGLGKTLQCLALIWILLKNGPYGSMPLVQRVLIVTPSSLVTNWFKEFKKWLTFQRLQPFIINQKQKPSEYANLPANSYPVMIISYEMLMRYYEDVKNINFQLLICDEGHRLKNNQSRISMLLSQLEINKRVLLTGTPVQNNLQEFFALIDFVNPGIVWTYAEFKKYFELPIVTSNQPHCCDESKKLGEARSQELNYKTNSFILRRTQSIIDQYLPTKQECVIFCSPSHFQSELYKAVISFWEESLSDDLIKIPHLNVIMILKKICNHPKLMKSEKFSTEISCTSNSIFEEKLFNYIQSKFQDFPDLNELKHSSKMLVLETFLSELENSDERIVLISYFTQTLDLFENLCNHKQYMFLRLDGSTSVTSRNEMVEKFNSPTSKYFVFLLSAKAGGVGLNLIGASRLVLFDLDWNPASDLQAMSRIWRDGQKRSVYIYRFLTSGSIEEKIYQRQISKTILSNAVVDIDQNASNVRLSIKELKDLFNFRPECKSLTHELLICKCAGDGLPDVTAINCESGEEDERDSQLSLSHQKKTKNTAKISELLDWDHFSSPISESVLEELYLKPAAEQISFIFRNKYSE